MTAHGNHCRIATWGLAIVLLIRPAIFGVPARAGGPPPQEITVDVDPGKSYQGNVGAGFDLIKQKATELKITLTSSKGTIKTSELYSCAPGANWSKIDETHWHCTGVGPNDKFWCIIKCTLVYPPGGSGEPVRWMSVSDVDFDADTDNNSDAAHRPPSRSQNEDYSEWPVPPTTGVIGLVIPLNDSNHVSWSQRDWGPPMSYDTDLRDVLDAFLEIHPKKGGEWNLSFPDCKRYTKDGIQIQDVNRHLNIDEDTILSLRLETLANMSSGDRAFAEATFIPDTPSAGYKASDKMWFIVLGCDIDVDTDNNGTIAGSNGDKIGEDFFEAHPGDSPLYVDHPEYKYGMLVTVNDYDDNNNGYPDNGWNGTDWSGPDGNSIENVQRFGVGKLQPLNVVDDTVAALLYSQHPRLQVTKLSGDGAVRLFDASGGGFNGVFAANGAAVTDISKSGWYRQRQYVTNLWVEGLRAGEVMLACQLYVNNILIHEDVVRITVVAVDLDAMKVSHNAVTGELDHSQKLNPGAFVPFNNDDDDYDGTPDYQQTGTVTAESDLLPIILHKVVPAVSGSKYKLDIPSNLKIWRNSDHSGAVTGTTEFDANVDTTLYAEGVSTGSCNITLKWTNGSLNAQDKIKVTVFTWLGPMNVPGYAIYRYTASGALSGSKWTTPVSGSVKTGANTSDVTILWGGGPIVGKAVYQANTNYVWDLEVNVVQVKIAGAGNSITYGNPPVQDATTPARIHSVASPSAMTANITIERMEGPTRGSHSHCGVKFVSAGFIQDGRWPIKRGLYNDSTPPKIRRSNLDGQGNHVDFCTGSTAPWYYSTTGLLAPSTDAQQTGVPLTVNDTPSQDGTDSFTLQGDQVDQVRIEMDFDLYVAVRTSDTRNNSDSIYTQRARANWSFIGTGDIDAAGVYTRAANAGNSGSASSTQVTSGEVVPVTTGTSCNQMLNSQTWTTE